MVAWRGGVLAVGVRGDRFAAWARRGGRWRPGGRFGEFAGNAEPAVTGLAVSAGRVFAAVSDGASVRLLASTDGVTWRERRLPIRLPAGGQDRILLTGSASRLLVVADDGSQPRAWLATVS